MSQPNLKTIERTDAPVGASSNQPAGEVISKRLGSLKLDKPGFRADMQKAKPARNLRRWVVLAVLLLLFCGGAMAYQKNWLVLPAGKFNDQTETDVVAVTINGADGGSDDAIVSISGYIIAESKIQVSAKVTGTVAELPIIEGSKVSKGDLLVRIESQTYEADLKQAQASVRIAESRLAELQKGSRIEEIEQLRATLDQAIAKRDLGQKEFGRAEKLQGTISEAEMDRAHAGIREAEAFVKQFKAALEMAENGARAEQLAALAAEVDRAKAIEQKAQYMYDCTRVVSDLNGTVLHKSVELGESLRIDPISGTSLLCTIADLNSLMAEVDVQERDLARISVGQPCRVAPEAAPENVYEAIVERRSPVVNRQRSVVQLKVRILNPDDKLMPDMSCKVTFLRQSDAPKDIVRVPRKALVKEGDDSTLFVLENDIARRRVVKTGDSHDQMVEITSGVKAGEKVLLSRQPLVDGQAVSVRVQ